MDAAFIVVVKDELADWNENVIVCAPAEGVFDWLAEV